jgi:ribonuclease HII
MLRAQSWSIFFSERCFMPHYRIELEYAPRRVCGVDEAGCGPWAGPVVAASVIFLDRKRIPRGLNDSKQLDKPTRQTFAKRLLDAPEHIITGIGIASVEEIDTLNIWGATMLAMQRAVSQLSILPELALVDGKRVPRNFPCEIRTIIEGDTISYSIAAASILAKTTRDRLMEEYAEAYPQYGFERHAGYGTKYHQEALATHGPCPIHRRSFRPIRELLAREAA